MTGSDSGIVSYIVVFLLAWFVAAPVLTLLHELGHTAMAFACGARGVGIRIGPGPAPLPEPPRRIAWSISLSSGFYGQYSCTPTPDTRWRQAAIIASGPVVSLLAAIALAALIVTNDFPGAVESFLFTSLTCAVVQFLSTVIPFTYTRSWGAYAGTESDGLRLLRLYRSS
jgi:hypothetical protein